MNYAMEGIFSTYDENIGNKIYNEKNGYVICSFSKVTAIKDILLWSYYTNGFKGIAVEINLCNNKSIEQIEYVNSNINISKLYKDDDIIHILTTKFNCWSHEKESRFLIKGDEKYYKIGNVTKVYFGCYKNLSKYY